MNTMAVLLVLSAFLVAIFFVSMRFWARRVFLNYWFWAIPSIMAIAYFIAFRYYEDWTDMFNYFNGNPNGLVAGGLDYSLTVSKSLFLDLCPFLSLAIPISLIADKSRRVATTLAPFAIFGTMIALMGGVVFDPTATFSLDYIFFGVQTFELYYLIHAYLLVVGIALFFASNTGKRYKEIMWHHLFIGGYMGYIILTSRLLNVNWNVTGTVANDWLDLENGVFKIVGRILQMDFPLVLLIPFSASYLIIVALSFASIKISKMVNAEKRIIEKEPKAEIAKQKLNKKIELNN